ncbi:MAG: hypothetical protein JWR16_711 [Nevskia sp.]|nr:hypothetical protein [Nevskia sp.]
MPDTENENIVTRKGRNLEDEIARQEAKLKKLQNDLKERKRREQERNSKAIFALLQAEHLDMIPVEQWQNAMPVLKSLVMKNVGHPKSAGDSEVAAISE